MTHFSEDDSQFESLLRSVRPAQPPPLKLEIANSGFRPKLIFAIAALLLLVAGISLRRRTTPQLLLPQRAQTETPLTILEWNQIAFQGDQQLDGALARAPSGLPSVQRPGTALNVLSKE